jgi:hypothetical protein
MDWMLDHPLVIMMAIVFGALLVMFMIGFCIYLYDVNIGEANMVKVTVDKVEIYKGKSAFIQISSGGYTTTVHIYRQLFPFNIVEKQYTSKDVVVEQL